MSRDVTLRKLIQAIERQKELGFREDMEPLDLDAVEKLEREARIRLATEELHERDYRETTH